MKFRILIIVMFTIFIGNVMSAGITKINHQYESSLKEDLFGGKINQENYKQNPYQELERVMKSENVLPAVNTFSEKYSRFIWFTFSMRIVLGLALSYISTMLIIKSVVSNQVKNQAHPVTEL